MLFIIFSLSYNIIYILNFKSISQSWQPWARNCQHSRSEKKPFAKNPIPLKVFEMETLIFSMDQQLNYKRLLEAEFLIFSLDYSWKNSKFLSVDFSKKFCLFKKVLLTILAALLALWCYSLQTLQICLSCTLLWSFHWKQLHVITRK